MFSVGFPGTSFTYDASAQSYEAADGIASFGIPHVPVAVPVPVDAVRGPGPGDELRYPLRRGLALRLRVEAALLVELGGEQRRVDGGAEIAPLLHEGRVRGGHRPLGQRLRPTAHAVARFPATR